jgi:glycosyltransferase involved in cell wall biosynthesis
MVGYLVRRFIPSTTVSQFLGAHDLMAAYPGSAQLARKADIIFTHSHSNLSRLNAIGIDSNVINVVVRGTKLDFPFEGDIDKFDSLKKPIFLTASRLIKEKGVDNVLKIFSNILNIYPEAILFIAGEGSFKYDLIKLAKSYSCINQIEFLGHLNQIELIKYMAKAHFFLLMSRYPSERLPNVVKEAMYQRCVVVTTDTDGIDELVENRVSGFVVKSGDYIAGINCVVECLKDVDKAKNIANQAHQTVKENFDVNMSMRKYIDLWQSSILRKNLL